MNFVAERRAQHGLAQTQPIGAKFAFNLQAMQLQRNFKIGEKIRAVKNAVMKLHVEKLDGEYVGRLAQLVMGKYERGKIPLLNPPLGGSVQVFQGSGVGPFYNAKNV